MELKEINKDLPLTLANTLYQLLPKEAGVIGVKIEGDNCEPSAKGLSMDVIAYEVFWEGPDGTVMKTSTAPASENELKELAKFHSSEPFKSPVEEN